MREAYSLLSFTVLVLNLNARAKYDAFKLFNPRGVSDL